MHNLLRETVRHLLERARDSEYRQIAMDAYKALLSAVDSRSVDELGMQITKVKETVIVYTTFEKLGVKLPEVLAGLSFGVHIGFEDDEDDELDESTNAVADGTSIAPGRLSFMPRGGLVIGFNANQTKTSKKEVERELSFGKQSIGTKRARRELASRKFSIERPRDIDVGHILRLRRAVFVHEMVHQLDANYRPDAESMSRYMSDQLKAGKYIETEHEQNAYFIQAFEDLVQTFEEQYPQPTRDRAKEFAPSAERLWQHFEKHISADIVTHFAGRQKGSERVPRYNDPKQKWMYVPKYIKTPDAMRRKYVARLTSMWDDYVASLPEE